MNRLSLFLLLSIWGNNIFAGVQPTSGEYTESIIDMKVKVMGGFVNVIRTWNAGYWEINRHWNRLIGAKGDSAVIPKTILRNGLEYERVGNTGELYRQGKFNTIHSTANGYRWQTRDGDWIDYDKYGYIEKYGDRNNVTVTIVHEPVAGQENGKRIRGVFDHFNKQVLFFDYDMTGRLNRIRDYSGRQVEYKNTIGGTAVGAFSSYGVGGSAALITKEVGGLERITDVRGFDWLYTYTNAGGSNGSVGSKSLPQLATITDPELHKTTIKYHGSQVASIEDDLGLIVKYQYGYDSSKREYYTQEINGVGTIKEHYYDKNGQLNKYSINGVAVQTVLEDVNVKKITDYGDLTTKFEYDEWLNVVKIVYPDDSKVSFEYDTSFPKETKFTNELGVITETKYDNSGNLIKKVEAKGTDAERVNLYTYDQYGNQLTNKRLGDAFTAEAVITTTYDDFGNVHTETDAEGNTTTFEYNVIGSVVSKKNANNYTYTYEYNLAGDLVKEIDPADNILKYDYDKLGNLIKETDQLNQVTSYAYNARKKLISIDDPATGLSSIKYDLGGRKIEETDVMGRVTKIEYDEFDRMTAIIYPSNDRTELNYALPGEGVGFFKPVLEKKSNILTMYYYDRRGKTIKTKKEFDGGVPVFNSLQLDVHGNVISSTDPAGRISKASYDALNRLKKIENKAGYRTTYKYNNNDYVTAVTNAKDIVIRQYEHDRNGKLTAEIWPDGSKRQFEYSPTGKLTAFLDPKGNVIRYVYDELDRLVEERWFMTGDETNPLNIIKYKYNKIGMLIEHIEGENGTSYIYDNKNRLISSTVNFGNFEATYGYEYNLNGSVSQMIYPDGTRITYDYDNAGRLLEVSIPSAGSIYFSNFNQGYPGSVKLPGGTIRKITYDGLLRSKQISVENNQGDTLMKHVLNYNISGNIVSRSTDHGDYTYQYDTADRLINADNPNIGDESYAYDETGNRIGTKDGSVWKYNNLDQLIFDGQNDYFYDENGNTIKIGKDDQVIRKYTWNSKNRLSNIYNSQGALTSEFMYDALGRMTSSEIEGNKTYFLNTKKGPIAEFDADGKITRLFGWRPTGIWGTDPLFIKTGDKIFFPQGDQLGTPWLMVDSSSDVIWAAQYEGFGLAHMKVGSVKDNPWRFPGQYALEKVNGLHYNLNRFYDPSSGRYTQPDPHKLNALTNSYLYVNANPITGFDPFGLFKICIPLNAELSATVGVGGKGGVNGECCFGCDIDCCVTTEICACAGLGGGVGSGPNPGAKGGIDESCNLKGSTTSGEVCCEARAKNYECSACAGLSLEGIESKLECCEEDVLGSSIDGCAHCEAKIGPIRAGLECCICAKHTQGECYSPPRQNNP